MIALDTNLLTRYLVCDDTEQAEAARSLLELLTVDRPGYVCREVTVTEGRDSQKKKPSGHLEDQ